MIIISGLLKELLPEQNNKLKNLDQEGKIKLVNGMERRIFIYPQKERMERMDLSGFVSFVRPGTFEIIAQDRPLWENEKRGFRLIYFKLSPFRIILSEIKSKGDQTWEIRRLGKDAYSAFIHVQGAVGISRFELNDENPENPQFYYRIIRKRSPLLLLENLNFVSEGDEESGESGILKHASLSNYDLDLIECCSENLQEELRIASTDAHLLTQQIIVNMKLLRFK